MKTFDHPNVLGLVGISLNTEDGTPMIAIPFMKYGDLKTFLVAKRRQTKVKNTLPEVPIYCISLLPHARMPIYFCIRVFELE